MRCSLTALDKVVATVMKVQLQGSPVIDLSALGVEEQTAIERIAAKLAVTRPGRKGPLLEWWYCLIGQQTSGRLLLNYSSP